MLANPSVVRQFCHWLTISEMKGRARNAQSDAETLARPGAVLASFFRCATTDGQSRVHRV